MYKVLDSVRGRLLFIVLLFASISHLAGLWLYVQQSDASTNLLHDALLADRISLVSKLVEKSPPSDVPALLDVLSSAVVGFSLPNEAVAGDKLPEGSRAHLLEHLLSVFLNQPSHDDIQMMFSSSGELAGTAALLSTINNSVHEEIHHLPAAALAEIRSTGIAEIHIKLRNGVVLHAAAPLLGVRPFSLWKIGGSLAIMLIMILPLAIWILSRWTAPLTVLALAAERLGRDIHAPPLSEDGLLEVRTTAHAFNIMQERIRQLVQDRIAIGAAIAHDLGTPVTRLCLRAQEIADVETRELILGELSQLRRMIIETLSFARMDLTAEKTEIVDLTSLVQRVCDSQADVGGDVVVDGPAHGVTRTKPMALHRILSNVIENAVKYGKRARVAIVEHNQSFELIIDDDGPGIPEAMLTEVFEPFRRLQQEENGTQGTGLGLTAARSLVKSIGGEITLGNRPEGGLRVSIHLPK